MSAITASEIPLQADSPAQRLRRSAAAVRVHFTWWGVHKTLTAQQKNLLARWIDQGAEYRGHWAFLKPMKPALPKVKDPSWVKNEIDAFVLERLEKAGLQPAPRADRTTLIRRLLSGHSVDRSKSCWSSARTASRNVSRSGDP